MWFKRDIRQDVIALLSGIGYYKLSERRRKLLRNVLIASLGAHVLFMVIFGSWVISKAIRGEKTTFEPKPVLKTYEPRKLELKVKVTKQQRSSSRPSMAPRMVAAKLTDLALPEIKVDPKIIKTSFQPKFKAVAGIGLGVGLGTGYGLGGFGDGVSDINFFGLPARGERVAILVDVSVSMVEEVRGGAKGYWKVKNRIGQVIGSLKEAALFNVIVFADASSAWQKQLVIGSDDNKTKAKLFLRPFNTEGNWGLTSGNLSPANIGLPAAGGTTRLDLALTAAFEQGADTILIISDGLPRVLKPVTAAQQQAYAAIAANWQAQNAAAIQQWQQAEAVASYAEERIWVPPTPAVPARPPAKAPLKEGQPIDQGSPAQPARPGHWEIRRVRQGGGRPAPQAPPPPQPTWWTLTDFIEHLKILHEKLYVAKGKKLPVIHCIGYGIDKEGGEFLRGLAEAYKGRYRNVPRMD
jgi:hypothetical protein